MSFPSVKQMFIWLPDFLMTDFYRYIETAKIGDDADAENLDSTMAGNNHFRVSSTR